MENLAGAMRTAIARRLRSGGGFKCRKMHARAVDGRLGCRRVDAKQQSEQAACRELSPCKSMREVSRRCSRWRMLVEIACRSCRVGRLRHRSSAAYRVGLAWRAICDAGRSSIHGGIGGGAALGVTW
jgi:hypothetical protein